jgi:RsiW-degrading membrane proteinase PrsW (M82 family)
MPTVVSFIVSAVVGILPVLVLLAVLQFLDSFKLVRLRVILWTIGAGAITGLLAYQVNGFILSVAEMEFSTYSRYIAPVVEEILKASIVLFLFKTHRAGFLVDAAILGFSVGAGFAVIENIYYLFNSDANLGVWIVRGFGTAVMHGGVTAIFAIVTMAAMEKQEALKPMTVIPGLLVAVVIHSAFNHFFFSPVMSSFAVFVLLPPFMMLVFARSNQTLTSWLELDFDADADLIAQLNSRDFSETHVGQYLNNLSQHFEGLVIVDILCYLRLYTELSMRAKGAMMMRQHGLEMPNDPAVAANFEEMRSLEINMGKTALLAIAPFLQINRRDLWHLNALESDLDKA